ncbi:MAG TPA: response regulator transcription factor [Verrucomicrobiae bacterium]|nr:response regulator transcription factor [Verrucomicrobiae bacterium]
MGEEALKCVLLADRHHGLTEGVRRLLETTFDAVVMVADEISLLESAERLHATLAIVDLSLVHSGNLLWLARLHAHCPVMKLIVLSVNDDPAVRRAAAESGADGFVLKPAIATDLLPAVDAVMAGQRSGLSDDSPNQPGERGNGS